MSSENVDRYYYYHYYYYYYYYYLEGTLALDPHRLLSAPSM